MQTVARRFGSADVSSTKAMSASYTGSQVSCWQICSLLETSRFDYSISLRIGARGAGRLRKELVKVFQIKILGLGTIIESAAVSDLRSPHHRLPQKEASLRLTGLSSLYVPPEASA